MYQVTDKQLNPLRLVRSPINIITHDNIRIDNATAWPVDTLKSMYVFPVTDPGKPDQTWQTVIGPQTIKLEGQANKPLEVTATIDYQVEPLSVEAGRSLLMSQIKNKRSDIEARGSFIWSLDGQDYLIQGDSSSVTQMERTRDLLNEMINNGVPVGQAVMKWRTADNQYTPPLTPSQINTMAYAKGLQGIAGWQKYAALEEEIDLAEDLPALQDIDINLGWPDVPDEVIT